MKKQKFVLFVILSIFFSNYSFSQTPQEVQQVLLIWNNTKLHDTTRIKAMFHLAEGYRNNVPDSTVMLIKKITDFANEKYPTKIRPLGISNILGRTYNLLGRANTNMGNAEISKKCFYKSYSINSEAGIKIGMAENLNALGVSYNDEGLVIKAIDYYLKALKIYDELNDSSAMAVQFGNIGLTFYDQKQYARAKEYFDKQIKCLEKRSDPASVADALLNMASVHEHNKEYDIAFTILNRCMELYKQANNKKGIGRIFYNLGDLAIKRGKDDEALRSYKNALVIYEEIGYKKGIARAKCLIANWYYDHYNLNLATQYGEEALNLSKELNNIDRISFASEILYLTYKDQKKYESALKMLELFQSMEDSIFNTDIRKSTLEQNVQFEFDKKEALMKAEQEKKDAISASELHRQKTIRYAITGGFGLTLLLAGSIFYSLQQNKKKNLIIIQQKELVEQKNIHILESIAYAQRIQTAILPPDKVVKEWLQSSFVLYKPKDIVSGDFYFMEARDGFVYFAAVDCTGHGVPGALVSVVGHTAIKRALDEFKLTLPHEILQKLNELVVETLKQQSDDESINDGMDIAFCRLHLPSNKLLFSGANRPLWLYRGDQLLDYKGNKIGIGGMKHEEDHNKVFKSEEIQLQAGDTFYISSDGFSDQFDPQDRKMMTRQFKEILGEIQNLNMQEQRAELNRRFEAWKSTAEQTDDVCVIGVRV